MYSRAFLAFLAFTARGFLLERGGELLFRVRRFFAGRAEGARFVVRFFLAVDARFLRLPAAGARPLDRRHVAAFFFGEDRLTP